MNILITGANGFIGSYISKKLSTNNTVFNLSRKQYNKKRVNEISLDLLDRKKVNNFFKKFSKKNKIDYIIHLASVTASIKTKNNIDILIKNIIITESLVNISKILKPKQIINFSSMSIYPNISGLYNEHSLPMPFKNSDCLYGLSKYCSENILDYFLQNTGINIAHLRVSQVYGSGMNKDRIIPVMTKELKKKNIINVYGNGERITNIIDINNLCKIIKTLLKVKINGIYNIGDENISLNNLAKKIIKEFGNNKSSINKIINGSRSKFRLDTKKIKRLIKNKYK